MAVDDQPGSSLSVPERTSPGNQFLLVLSTEVTELIFVTLVARGAAGCANVGLRPTDSSTILIWSRTARTE